MPKNQDTIIYLMFLNGILFLGLNFIAHFIIYPDLSRSSKRLGYTLIISVLSAFFVQQEYRALLSLGFSSQISTNILLGGFIVPVFLISLVYYRIRRNREDTSDQKKTTKNKKNENY